MRLTSGVGTVKLLSPPLLFASLSILPCLIAAGGHDSASRPTLIDSSARSNAFAEQDPAADKQATRPNILFAIADDWGYPHASAYGDPVVRTPTFDKVATEGVLFQHAYVSSPSCTPSRAAIVTGQYHWRLKESANLHSTLRAEIPVYTDLLEDAGYHVGHSRKGWGPGRHQVGGRDNNPAGDRYKDLDEFMSKRPPDAPFCYWFGSYDPHRTYTAGSGAASGMQLDDIDIFACFPDSPEVRGDVADYYFEVQRFDREVGEIIESLRESGQLQNTLVVITGDHGMPFPRCKANLYDTGTRVPLAMMWPAGIPSARGIQDFVSLTDLAPTFLELAGIEAPVAMTGRSLLSSLTSEASGSIGSERDHVLFGKERHTPCQEAPDMGGYPCRAIRTADHLYIYNWTPDRWPSGTPNHERATKRGGWFSDTDNGPTKQYLFDHRDDPLVGPLFQLSFGKRPQQELYDLRADPEQLHNIADDPKHARTMDALHEQLMQELKASGDPRTTGDGRELESYPYYGGAPKWTGDASK